MHLSSTYFVPLRTEHDAQTHPNDPLPPRPCVLLCVPLQLFAFLCSSSNRTIPPTSSTIHLSRGPNGAESRSALCSLLTDGVWQADVGASVPCAVQQHAPRDTAALHRIPCYSAHAHSISASCASTPGEREGDTTAAIARAAASVQRRALRRAVCAGDAARARRT